LIFVIDSEEKDGSLILQGNRFFGFYGSMHFLYFSILLSVIGLTEKLFKIYTLSVIFSKYWRHPIPSS